MIRVFAGIALLIFSASFVRAAQATAGQTKGCTRSVLQAAVDGYLDAQKAGNLSKASLAAKVKYIENMKEIKREQGLWNTPLPIAFHRSFLDVNSCRAFTEVIVTEGAKPAVLGTRLKVKDGKITEVDSLVTRKSDWLFNADDYLKYSKAEEWPALKVNERVDRKALIKAGNSYFDHFSNHAVKVPFNTPCARLEGGMYTTKDFNDPKATCDLGFPEGKDKLSIFKRDYVVDVEMGTVNIFCRFGNPPGAPDSHTFRLVNGKIRYVHTLTLIPAGASIEQIMGRPAPSTEKPKRPTPPERK
jgi:hypothetical protein